MMGLIRGEWIKVFSTKLWWIMLLTAAALTSLGALPVLLVANLGEEIPELDVAGPALLEQVWSTMGSAAIIAMILGILSFTSEYRHETITDTFLTEPRRGRVVAAKAAVNAVLGAMVALVSAVTVIGLALWLLPDGHAPIDWSYVVRIVLAVVLTDALYAILGVSVGALITSQLAAVLLALLWVLLIEGLIAAINPTVGKWLPGGAAQSILGGQSSGVDLLPPVAGVAVLLAYTVALGALAASTTLRRDIT